MKNKVMFPLIMLISAYFFTGCNESGTSSTKTNDDTTTVANKEVIKIEKQMEEGMMTSMERSAEKMKSIKMTGDFDLDYITTMIDHHQVAVEVSEMAVSKGADAQVKMIAQKMITDHTAEIAELKKFMSNHDTTSAEHKKANAASHSHDGGSHNELSEDIRSMTDNMKAMTMSGNVDKDYVNLMIAHHQNAVKLSQNELSHGHHEALKNMAKKMISDDNREIKELQKWLSSMK